ncbi:unnamed protein product [Protopolystoma xenopodis]|uniref:Uncharacterized protein n=1 Tax=Protopolystoma xenopodis TaxID=117903 RepID=A0A448X730_9PLAT|nr:unnamed protein product [Protopolystoma xenopodis]
MSKSAQAVREIIAELPLFQSHVHQVFLKELCSIDNLTKEYEMGKRLALIEIHTCPVTQGRYNVVLLSSLHTTVVV